MNTIPAPERIINNWKPETRSLINRIRKAGWTIVSSDNGEDQETFKTVAQTVNHLTSTDEGHLTVKSPDGKTYCLFLVYGNSPGELVCDYSYPRSGDLLEPIIKAHYESWEGRKQPTITWEKVYGTHLKR